jgi:hypothetical protein
LVLEKPHWSANGSTRYNWLKTLAVQAGAHALENGHANFIGFGS